MTNQGSLAVHLTLSLNQAMRVFSYMLRARSAATTSPTAASIAVTMFAKRTRNGFTRPVLLELYRCNVDTLSEKYHLHSGQIESASYRRGLERGVRHGEGHEEEERGGAAVLGGVGVGVLVDDRYGALGEGFAGVHPVNPRACSPSRLSAAQAVR